MCQSIARAQSVSQFQTALLSKTLIWVPLNRNHWFMVFYQCVPLPLVNPLYIPLSSLYSCPLTVPRFKRINLDWDNWAQAKVDWLCFMNLLSSSLVSSPPSFPSHLSFTDNLPRPFLAVIITAEISSLSFSLLLLYDLYNSMPKQPLYDIVRLPIAQAFGLYKTFRTKAEWQLSICPHSLCYKSNTTPGELFTMVHLNKWNYQSNNAPDLQLVV